MISERERESAIRVLTQAQQTLKDAIDGVTEEQARWKPSPERWSVIEYVEHLTLADGSLLARVKQMLATPPREETDVERRERTQAIRQAAASRHASHAPADMTPAGSYKTLADTFLAYSAAHEQAIEFARTTQDELRNHFDQHPSLGLMDAYQWLTTIGRHAELHAGQILDLRRLEGFPKG